MLLLLIGCGEKSQPTAELMIFAVTNKENIGDANQIRGLVSRIQDAIGQKKNVVLKEMEYSEFDPSKEIANQANDGKEKLVVSSGIYGIDVIQKLCKSEVKNLTTVHLSHQLLDRHRDLFEKESSCGANYVVLPEHVINDQIGQLASNSGTKLLTTVGVFHNLKLSDIEHELDMYRDSIPSSSKYLAVILGGDVQLPDGTWQHYTISDVARLAVQVLDHAQKHDQFILVLNGPRTGKHDEAGNLDSNAHRGNVDSVTKSFMDIFFLDNND
jgi:hypothetical protein